MTLANVQEAVLGKARAEAEAVLEEARRSADARFEHESGRLRAEHARRIELLRADLEAALGREAGAREAEDRSTRLRLKNEIIEDVFRRAVEGVLSLPGDGCRRWLKAQIEQLPAGNLRLTANSRDRQVLAGLIEEAGRSGVLGLGETAAPIQGGFLVQGKEFDLDFSVEALMGTLRELLSQEVASSLFGDERE